MATTKDYKLAIDTPRCSARTDQMSAGGGLGRSKRRCRLERTRATSLPEVGGVRAVMMLAVTVFGRATVSPGPS